MIVYNVTVAVEPRIEEEFLDWLSQTHIPEVLSTGLFEKAEIFKVIEDMETKAHSSFAIQYRLESWEHLDTYQREHASALQQKTREKYGENVLAFRTFLEQLEELD